MSDLHQKLSSAFSGCCVIENFQEYNASKIILIKDYPVISIFNI